MKLGKYGRMIFICDFNISPNGWPGRAHEVGVVWVVLAAGLFMLNYCTNIFYHLDSRLKIAHAANKLA